MKRLSLVSLLCSPFLFIGIWIFLWLGCPQYLLYREQYQLFLFTGDYFYERISLPGGLADYISEFIVQFYYVPLYGALLTALLLTSCQLCLALSLRKSGIATAASFLSAAPAVMFLGAMGDENVLLSFAVAMTLSSIFIYADSLRHSSSLLVDIALTILAFVLLYWLAGPLAFVYVVASGILHRRPLAIVFSLAAAFAAIYAIQSLTLPQYPLSRLMQGIDYYRVPETYPAILYAIAAVMALLPLLSLVKTHAPRAIVCASAALMLIFSLTFVYASFDKDKSRLLMYDALVRQGRWNDIINKAKNDSPYDTFSQQAVNLALGMTGQLTESMFSFPQKGMESLIGRDRLDNTTQLITAEALYRIGLTNIAFSTTFDLQEAVMNDRKSGRMMKRMAECMLINGNYKVASKYIGMLRNSLFYSDWASEASALLHDDKAVEAHPVYGPLRRNGFSKVAFYDYSQLDKILAMHATGGNGLNNLAWQYFCAATLLKGDLPTLVGVYNYASDTFGMGNLPRHMQEAMALYWTFSHENFDGIPFPINTEVRQQTALLAQSVMQNRDNPSAWKAAAPGSYGVYYLSNMLNPRQSELQSSYIHTHE